MFTDSKKSDLFPSLMTGNEEDDNTSSSLYSSLDDADGSPVTYCLDSTFIVVNPIHPFFGGDYLLNSLSISGDNLLYKAGTHLNPAENIYVNL